MKSLAEASEEVRFIVDVLLHQHDNGMALIELLREMEFEDMEYLDTCHQVDEFVLTGQWQKSQSLIQSAFQGKKRQVKRACDQIFIQRMCETLCKENEQISEKDALDMEESSITLAEIYDHARIRKKSGLIGWRAKTLRKIWTILSPFTQKRLGQLLLYAAQFEQIHQNGFGRLDIQVDIMSYMFAKLCLSLLCKSKSISAIEILRILASKVKTIGQFLRFSDLQNLVKVLRQSIEENPDESMWLLRDTEFIDVIKPYISLSPLEGKVEFKGADEWFDYVCAFQLYGDEKSITSILELGAYMENIFENSQLSTTVDVKEYTRTPICSNKKRYKVHSLEVYGEVWSVAANATHVLVGTDAPENSLCICKVDEDRQLRTVGYDNDLHGIEQIRINPDADDSFLVSSAGDIYYVKLLFDSQGEYQALTKQSLTDSASSTSSNDSPHWVAQWMPGKRNVGILCDETSRRLNIYELDEDCINEFQQIQSWELPEEPASFAVSGKHIVILTVKKVNVPQAILLFDTENSTIASFDPPKIPDDVQYTTILCSRWDPRTIVLLSPPNKVLILDKYGKRVTRALYGPMFKTYIMKAEFAGPMDKYLLVTSEDRKSPKAYVYNRFTGAQVKLLNQHALMVNAVTSDSSNIPFFITGGDDKYVTIYSESTETDLPRNKRQNIATTETDLPRNKRQNIATEEEEEEEDSTADDSEISDSELLEEAMFEEEIATEELLQVIRERSSLSQSISAEREPHILTMAAPTSVTLALREHIRNHPEEFSNEIPTPRRWWHERSLSRESHTRAGLLRDRISRDRLAREIQRRERIARESEREFPGE